MTDIEKVVEAMKAFNADPQQVSFNPFRRPGMTMGNIADTLQYWIEERTASGRVRNDRVRTNKLIKEMLKQGLIEELGKYRTMQCGSKYLMCYNLVDR